MLILFFAFWLILNARLTLEIAVSGAVISVFMVILCYRLMPGISRTERKITFKLFSIIAYFIALIFNVIKANIGMIKLILSPGKEIKPQIVYIAPPVRSDGAQVALVSSMNLTPGTVVVAMEDDQLGIHVIDASLAESRVKNSVYTKRLRKIEGGH